MTQFTSFLQTRKRRPKEDESLLSWFTCTSCPYSETSFKMWASFQKELAGLIEKVDDRKKIEIIGIIREKLAGNSGGEK